MKKRAGLRALVAAAVLLGAATAWAQGEATPDAQAQARARMHFQQGKAAFELGNFREALEQYESAYRIAPLPGFLFNIGQCHRNLREYEKAIFAFRLYLRKRPEADNREAVLLLIKDLQSKIEERDRQKRVATYVPESRPFVENPPPPRPRPTPLYKRWWLWTAVGVAAGAAAVGVYFATRTREAQIPETNLGTWDVTR